MSDWPVYLYGGPCHYPSDSWTPRMLPALYPRTTFVWLTDLFICMKVHVVVPQFLDHPICHESFIQVSVLFMCNLYVWLTSLSVWRSMSLSLSFLTTPYVAGPLSRSPYFYCVSDWPVYLYGGPCHCLSVSWPPHTWPALYLGPRTSIVCLTDLFICMEVHVIVSQFLDHPIRGRPFIPVLLLSDWPVYLYGGPCHCPSVSWPPHTWPALYPRTSIVCLTDLFICMKVHVIVPQFLYHPVRGRPFIQVSVFLRGRRLFLDTLQSFFDLGCNFCQALLTCVANVPV